jgi:hypothetical protein
MSDQRQPSVRKLYNFTPQLYTHLTPKSLSPQHLHRNVDITAKKNLFTPAAPSLLICRAFRSIRVNRRPSAAHSFSPSRPTFLEGSAVARPAGPRDQRERCIQACTLPLARRAHAPRLAARPVRPRDRQPTPAAPPNGIRHFLALFPIAKAARTTPDVSPAPALTTKRSQFLLKIKGAPSTQSRREDSPN